MISSHQYPSSISSLHVLVMKLNMILTNNIWELSRLIMFFRNIDISNLRSRPFLLERRLCELLYESDWLFFLILILITELNNTVQVLWFIFHWRWITRWGFGGWFILGNDPDQYFWSRRSVICIPPWATFGILVEKVFLISILSFLLMNGLVILLWES